jgi:hypothetical protein
MMTTIVVINLERPLILVENVQVDFSTSRPQLVKYLPYHNFYKLDSPAQKIVRKMELFFKSGYRSTYIDYKVRELNTGDCGCPLEQWHIDVTKNPLHDSRPDIHFIFSTVIGTEFMLDEISCVEDDFSKLKLPSNPRIFQAMPNSIVQYNRFNMHRGPIVKEPCRRVLIRVTQTDVF